MPMMFVMRVRVRMSHRFVNMLVLVALGQMKPDPHCHKDTGNGELCGDWFAEHEDCRDAAEKRCGREVGPRARGAEMPQCDHEQGQAHAIPEEADHAGNQDGGERRQRGAQQQAQYEVEGTRDQPLQLDDLQWIRERDLSRQIVVEAPGEACADDGERTDQAVHRRVPDHDSVAAPVTRQAMPSAIRRSKFS